jgi:hypothetical protein
MDDSEVEDRLQTTGTGVLALSRDGDACAIPLAYYDGDRLYFRPGLTEGSTKREFWETTEAAWYVLYRAEPADDPVGWIRGASSSPANSSNSPRRNTNGSTPLRSQYVDRANVAVADIAEEFREAGGSTGYRLLLAPIGRNPSGGSQTRSVAVRAGRERPIRLRRRWYP